MLVFVVCDLVLSFSVIVVSFCCRHCRSNLNEPLDRFPFLDGCWTKRWPGLRLIYGFDRLFDYFFHNDFADSYRKKTFTSKKLHITFVNNNLLCVPNCYFLPAKSNVLVYRRFDLLREVFIRTEFRFVTCCRLLPLFRLWYSHVCAEKGC